MDNTIAEYRRSAKERKYRALFVYECCRAAEMVSPTDCDRYGEIIIAATAKFFESVSDKLIDDNYMRNNRRYDAVTFPSAVPLLKWFHEDESFPEEWYTARLEDKADHILKRGSYDATKEELVMLLVEKGLERNRKFLAEEKRLAAREKRRSAKTCA